MSRKQVFGRLPDANENAPAQRRRKSRSEPTPDQRALGLLVRREHSRKELERKLATRGVEAEEAKAAVEKMCGEGWQSDERFAELLVRSRAANGYGPLHVRAELGSHGVPHDLIAAAMENFDGDWNGIARGLIRRRFGERGPQDMAQRRKAGDLLMRRGFAGDQVRAALDWAGDD